MFVVIDKADAVMIAAKDRVKDVKHIVNRLRSSDRPEAILHIRIYRPWGSYESMIVGKRFQIGIFTVKPGEILSLQMHHHRAEHWIVVSGTAVVTKGEKKIMLH